MNTKKYVDYINDKLIDIGFDCKDKEGGKRYHLLSNAFYDITVYHDIDYSTLDCQLCMWTIDTELKGPIRLNRFYFRSEEPDKLKRVDGWLNDLLEINDIRIRIRSNKIQKLKEKWLESNKT